MKTIKIHYIVVALGYWGSGKTIKEAAENCRKSGAYKTEKVLVKAVIEPKEPPFVDDGGSIHYKSDYPLEDVLKFVKLGALTDSEDPNRY